MKRFIIIATLVSLFTITTQAQTDTMYIMKNGAVLAQYNVNTEIDSVIFYNPLLVQSDTVGTFTDSRDGNTYNWAKIGDQIWMAENLAYLPSVNNVADGFEDAAGSYYYVNDFDGTDVAAAKATTNYTTYGVLYSWTAALTACPSGWHLPSDAEWTQLTNYLGSASLSGGKMKSTTGWNAPNLNATNSSGFSGLPGGYRASGLYGSIGSFGAWWSSTENNTSSAWERSLHFYLVATSNLARDKEYGLSCRCLKD